MALDLILELVALLIAGLVAVLVTRRLARWLSKASAQTKVRLAPVRRTMLTKDCRPTFATVRPTTGDELPREVLEQLERYVADRDTSSCADGSGGCGSSIRTGNGVSVRAGHPSVRLRPMRPTSRRNPSSADCASAPSRPHFPWSS